jgi:uncharacterized protein YegL
MAQQILPFYLLCDESGSMAGDPLDAINKSLPELHMEIGSNPVVSDKTRFCLMGFSDVAEVLLPLSDLSTVSSMPSLQPSGGTDYTSAFAALRQTIDTDVAALKAQGHSVYRPAVFFLSDGYPNDNGWHTTYNALIDPAWKAHPHILAFGFGDADATTIQQVATAKAFIANGDLGPAQALREFANSLIKSIVSSGTVSASDPNAGAKLVMPNEVPGFTTLDADTI